MPGYFLEAYSADSGVSEARRRARRAADLGSGVRHLRTTFLPADETLFHVFEAPSAEALREAGRRAALHYERIVEAVEACDPGSEPEAREGIGTPRSNLRKKQ